MIKPHFSVKRNLMFTTLSKTVAVVSIMCTTVLYAQSNTVVPQLNVKDSTQVTVKDTTKSDVKNTAKKADSTKASALIPAAIAPAAIIPAAVTPVAPNPAIPAASTATPAVSKAPIVPATATSAAQPDTTANVAKAAQPDTTAKTSIPDTTKTTTTIAKPDSILPSPEPLKTEIITVVDTSKIQITERQAQTTVVAIKDSTSQTQNTDKPKRKLSTYKTIQSYNFSIPMESEKWKVTSEKPEWKSTGFQFNWTRYKTNEGGYSTLFGLGAGFVSGKLKDKLFDEKVKFTGLDLNMKMGLGVAPISNDLIVATHFICGVDVKLANGNVTVDDKKINPFTVYVDAVIGGAFILGYQFFESAGFLAGIDVTTNAFGIGGYSRELSKTSKVKQLNYAFTGINITPHIGIFFAF